jgi:FkbM family methyltransferase
MKNFSVLEMVKKILKKVGYTVGIEFRKVDSSSKGLKKQNMSPAQTFARSSLSGILQHAKHVGVSPRTVIDVGAAYGNFTTTCRTFFPDARYILVEPLEEYTPYLQSVITTGAYIEYILAVATDESGETSINVHPDLVGSSLYKENEDSEVNGVERAIPAVTLDEICTTRHTTGPYLIKIDTQGAELKVLSGTEKILQETEFITLEVSLFEFFKEGGQFYDYITFMKARGFVVYDIFDLQYRLFDGAMSQVDIAFVRENGQLRKLHCYATKEQREQQNQRFRGRK